MLLEVIVVKKFLEVKHFLAHKHHHWGKKKEILIVFILISILGDQAMELMALLY
jgi:hypothetical protein